MKRVSIVTVTYNCASVIDETLQSIVNQDYSNKQIVVIDGKSRDDTLKRINAYRTCIDVLISEPDKGIFDAMNKSLEYVDGDYVIFINAGDKFVNGHVLTDVFRTYEGDDDLIYGDVLVENDIGYLFKKGTAVYEKNYTSRTLVFEGQGFSHQSLFTKACMLKRQRFDTSYRLGADFLTTCMIYEKGNRQIKYLGFPVSIFDDRTQGASHNGAYMPEIIEERLKMFDYKLAFRDKLIISYLKAKSSIKYHLKNSFPVLTERFRLHVRNYIKELK